jgi:MATE family multidrug resistance protein
VLEALPSYWFAMSAMLVPFTLTMVVKHFLDSIERPWTGAALSMVPVILNVPLNWMLIYGHMGFPAMGLSGAGIASFVAFSLGFLVSLLYIRLAPSMRRYRHAYSMSNHDFSDVAHNGYPMMIQYLAEGGAVAVAGVLVGLAGTVALAANQIVFSVGYLVYMVPLGVAAAVSIRVAQASGESATHRIRAIGLAGIAAVSLWTLPFTALMISQGRTLARGFVDDAVVIEAAAAIFVAVGFFQFFDGLQSVCLGALRGLLDSRWPTVVSLVAYWLVALPLGACFAFTLGLGAPGIWAGFGVGLAVAGVLLLARFLARTRGL